MTAQNVIARWPAMMARKTAVEYLDVSDAAFEREIAAGRLPEGIMFGGRPHWRKDVLDKAIAVVTGELPADDFVTRFYEKYSDQAAA
jgi:LPS sulfotransferase NodH